MMLVVVDVENKERLRDFPRFCLKTFEATLNINETSFQTYE